MADMRNRTPFYGAVPTSKLNADHVFMADGSTLQEQADKKFELIESITLTEDVSVVERATEPDTTPYNFTDLLITTEIPAGTANYNMRISVNNDALRFTIYRARISSGTSYAMAKMIKELGIFDFVSSYATGDNTLSAGMLNKTPYYVEHVNIADIALTIPSQIIPEGSIINIYAVRA